MTREPGSERRRSEPFETHIQGALMPVRPNGQPVLMELPGNPSRWLLLFDDPDRLLAEMDRLGIAEFRIQRVTDGRQVVADAHAQGVRIARNPHLVNGNTHWTEIAPLGEL